MADRCTIFFRSSGAVEFDPEHHAEALPEGRGEKSGPGGCSHQGERGEGNLHGSGGRTLADDEVELEVFHGRIKDLFDHVVQAVHLVDEEDIPSAGGW